MRRFFGLAACVVVLAGCAAAQSTMLTDNTALVSAIANSTAPHDKVIEDALTEAARITRAHGYQYFIILKAEDASRSGTITVPGQQFANQTAHVRPFGATSLSAPNVSGATFTTPGKTVPYVRPGVEVTIRMYRQGEIDPRMDGVWNADGSMPPQPPDRTPPARERTASALRG